jgi:hypothetical protein
MTKMLRQQKKVTFSTLERFFNALSHTPELHVQRTKLLKIKARVCCVRACNFSILARIVLAVA